MLPMIQPAIDRSERSRQRATAFRGARSRARAGVTSSGIACTICQMGCSALSGTAQAVCMAACNATVC